MSCAFLFAGQGSQHAGMGRDLYGAYPAFAEVVDAASERLGRDLATLMFDDPEGVLDQTEHTQPALVAFACGLGAVLADRGIAPDVAAGLSLGEYSALAAAGVLSAVDAVELVAFRGAAMAAAADGRSCAMVSVLGLDHDRVAAVAEDVRARGLGCVEVSNHNCPGQTVVAGDEAAVAAAVEGLGAAGARRCIPLKVSGPFHTSLMAPAAQALRERLDGCRLADARIPVLFNCLGHEAGPGDDIRDLLERQVRSCVRMEETIQRLAGLGVDRVVEVGPGRVLSGLVRKTAPNLTCTAVETVEDVERLAKEMGENR